MGAQPRTRRAGRVRRGRPERAILQCSSDISTVRLTEAVAFRGIGNRPGASEMNSGYRWPYGRREGVLPVWATRRAAAPGAQSFPRVVFQNRVEGLASRSANTLSILPFSKRRGFSISLSLRISSRTTR